MAVIRSALRRLLLAAALLAACTASAQYAWTMREANVRAGPDREYPLVAWLPLGTVVEIFGCVEGWRWCEIRWETVRGFVYAGFLAYPYGDGYVSVRDAGPYLGLPVVSFALPGYWGAWYADRPWYPQWSWWASRPTRPPPGWQAPRHPPAVHQAPPAAIVPPITRPVTPFTAAPPPSARSASPAGAAPAPRSAPPGAKADQPSPRPGQR